MTSRRKAIGLKKVWVSPEGLGLRRVKATWPDGKSLTIIRFLDQFRVYLHGVADNFSWKVLGWRLESSISVGTTRQMLLEAIRQLRRTGECINGMTDGGSENFVFGAGDEVCKVAERVVGQVDVAASNSMVEALWSQLRHRWFSS